MVTSRLSGHKKPVAARKKPGKASRSSTKTQQPSTDHTWIQVRYGPNYRYSADPLRDFLDGKTDTYAGYDAIPPAIFQHRKIK